MNNVAKYKQNYYKLGILWKKQILMILLKPLLGKEDIFNNIYNYLDTTSTDQLIESELDEVYEILIEAAWKIEDKAFKQAASKLENIKIKMSEMKKLEQEMKMEEEKEIESLFDNI